MSRSRVRLALPWLQSALAEAAASATVPPLDALDWLAGRGRLDTRAGVTWREWLLEPVAGVAPLSRTPAGPAMAVQHRQRVDGTGTWCLAQPVHLAAGLDHLRLAALAAAAPTDDEAQTLAATVSAHFTADEMQVVGFFDGAWLLRLGAAISASTQPPDAAVGHNVHDFMPAGTDGARVRSLMNEIQMLLHEHPVNVRRERTRQLPINGWWLWGFGASAPALATVGEGWTLHTDDPWLRALWRAETATVDSVALQGDVLQGDRLTSNRLIALAQPPAPVAADALSTIAKGLLAGLVAQVRAGSIQQLDLLAGDVTLALERSARFQFWRRPVAASRWLS